MSKHLDNLIWQKYHYEITQSEKEFAEEFYSSNIFIDFKKDSEKAYLELIAQKNLVFPHQNRTNLLSKYKNISDLINSYILKFQELSKFQNFYNELNDINEFIKISKKDIFYALEDLNKIEKNDIHYLKNWLESYKILYLKIIDKLIFNILEKNDFGENIQLSILGIKVPKNEMIEILDFLKLYKLKEHYFQNCYNRNYINPMFLK